ncbi:MAG: hypothetical protein WCI36_01520 [bacterium]
MTNKKIASEIAVGIILLIAVVVGGIFWLQSKSISKIQNTTNNNLEIQKPVAQVPAEKKVTMCTQEAKLCEDGKTYVGRSGENCEFAPCPNEKKNITEELCEKKENGGVFQCGKYFKVMPPRNVTDMPWTVYDENRKLLGHCGGMPGPEPMIDPDFCYQLCVVNDLCHTQK